MAETTIEYLRRVLEQTRLTPTALAKKAGVASTTLTRPLDGDHPHQLSLGTLHKIEAATGIVPAVSSAGLSAEELSESVEFVAVPRIGVVLSGGAGASVLDEKPIDRIPFTREFLRRKLARDSAQGLIMVEVTGDSMAPSIRSGDLVMIDMMLRTIDGSISAFRQGNELMVKRLQRVGSGIQVISDNETVPDYVLGPAEMPDFELLGQVRWMGRVL